MHAFNWSIFRFVLVSSDDDNRRLRKKNNRYTYVRVSSNRVGLTHAFHIGPIVLHEFGKEKKQKKFQY